MDTINATYEARLMQILTELLAIKGKKTKFAQMVNSHPIEWWCQKISLYTIPKLKLFLGADRAPTVEELCDLAWEDTKDVGMWLLTIVVLLHANDRVQVRLLLKVYVCPITLFNSPSPF
jgi:hypothetical protein